MGLVERSRWLFPGASKDQETMFQTLSRENTDPAYRVAARTRAGR
jgi:hypothetical protein